MTIKNIKNIMINKVDSTYISDEMYVFNPNGIAPQDNIIDEFDIRKGNTVIDYGCGPGNYVKRTSELVGESGKIYAVDIQNLSIVAVKKVINKYGLTNVEPLLAKNDANSNILENNIADIILAMDMFQQVQNKNLFLHELHRLVKADGFLLIKPDHMSLESAQKLILDSGVWKIECELSTCYKCIPLN